MKPVTSHPGPHLLLDDFLIDRQEGLERVVVPPSRLPEPVVTGPEDRCFQPYVTVLRDPASRRFRIWYGVPESASQSHVATMESDDGIHWRRPHRVLRDPGRIQFGVSVLDRGPDAPDPERRYAFGWWDDGGLQVAGSPDGLTWKKLAPGPVVRHNHDINNLYRDPIRGRYAANLSVYGPDPLWKGNRRATWQAHSDDLIHWSEPHRIVWPDARDGDGVTEFYAMGGVLARGELLIAFARVLRDDLAAEAGGPVAGLGFSQLTWSRDGRTWEREREPWLDRNATPGTWDRAMAWADCQLVVGDAVYVYYGGYRRGHKVERFTERQIGLARMPLDRYVARRAGASTGTLTTRPMAFAGTGMTVNAAVRGALTVRLLDASGAPIPGVATATVRGDGVALPVRWGRSAAKLAGRTVRVEFRLTDGELFAFGWTGPSPEPRFQT